MHFSALLALGAFAATSLAVPSSLRHVVHEKRSKIPSGWAKDGKVEGHRLLPMRVALTQSNLDKMEEYLMEVSHPESSRFGQHWNAKQIAEAFAPSKETVDTVRGWLESSGIHPDRVAQSQSLGWLHFDATVDEVESLLKTKYHSYTHESGTPQIACEEYHVPEHISKHLDFITPTVHFDAKIKPPTTGTDLEKRKIQPGIAHKVGQPGSGSLPKQGEVLNFIKDIITELEQCDEFIVPDCLRALYLIPPVATNLQKNAYGIVEYSPQAYLQGDLDLFFANYSRKQVQRTPTLVSIDGGYAQTQAQGFQFNGESDLDLEYAMTLVNPITVSLYQVGDPYESGSFNTFLDALDASYCTFEGGDDITQDPVYPDTTEPDGYKGPNECGGAAATKVISTSYGYNEADLTPFYEMRQCQEYAKLGMQGTTVLYSSGDYGVAGNGGQCIDPATGNYNNGSSGIFNPSFPGGCPYVTSVGATQIKPNATVVQPEEACETVIFSGGGFSNVFPQPAYQKAAIANYYAKFNPPYGADRYNNSRVVRGFPDVSANGANYVVAVDGEFSLVFGTSASSPTFGSVVTIINEYRAAVGKGSVGFLNPTLYANPGVLNDITSGGNQGCGTPGFTAVPGWDPVTGLGTPNTPKMLKLFLGL